MDYAVPTDRVFVTGSTVKTKTRPSKEAQSIRKFCTTHTVKVYNDPQTVEIIVDVAEIEAENDAVQRNE